MKKTLINLDQVVQAMKDRIAAHGLQLLQNYPNDLLIHDRRIMEAALVPGVTMGWVVGHNHTHLIVLGVHPQENDMAPYLTRLSESDRYYTIALDGRAASGVAITEASREAFAALANLDVPYRSNGPVESFDLYRHTQMIGHVTVRRQVTDGGTPVYLQTIEPTHRATDADRVALLFWAEKAAVKAAHTLFCQTEVTWQEPGAEALAA